MATAFLYKVRLYVIIVQEMANQISVLKQTELCGQQFMVYGSVQEPMFFAQDVATMLRLTNVSDMVQRVDEDERSKFNLGRQGDGWFLTENGLYEILMQSRKPIAKQFKKGVKTILKEIRTNGGYIATSQEDTPELIMARALQVAQTTIEKHNARIMQLEAENAKINKVAEQAEEQVLQLSETVVSMKPKADYCDIILQSKETVATTQIAQDYGMTAKALNILLRNFGIQHKVAGQWVLYAPYLPLGYVQSESIPITHTDGRKTIKLFSKWTQKGRLFLYEELKKHNVLPLIEKKEEVA